MITTSNLDSPSDRPPAQVDARLIASVDVEWTKNYKIRGGNIPFCFSVVCLSFPTGRPVDMGDLPFSYTSVYVEDAAETQQLIATAAEELRIVFQTADLVVGHQFTSDLAVLANAATTPHEDIQQARQSWRQRRDVNDGQQIIDTRYDAGHVLTTASRRLVDVCTDLRLDVTQPELRGSMTAMHRAWLETGETELRERISVLNLRHSLSAALIAARTADLGHWNGTLNVNRLLNVGLDGSFAWLTHPTFTALLEH